jgi:predicted nucleic acid-binding protein
MYLDTSVAAKLYIREPDSDEIEAAASSGDGLFSSELLYAELRSAMLGKERVKALSSAQREMAWNKFQEHLEAGLLQLLPLNGIVIREASEVIAQVHPQVALRSLDAIHLATALSVDAGPLLTRDKRMIEAAKKLGLALAD